MTPLQRHDGTIPDLRHLRAFGSSIVGEKPGKLRVKLDLNHADGIFLHDGATHKHIIYFDVHSQHEKTATHYSADEWHIDTNHPRLKYAKALLKQKHGPALAAYDASFDPANDEMLVLDDDVMPYPASAAMLTENILTDYDADMSDVDEGVTSLRFCTSAFGDSHTIQLKLNSPHKHLGIVLPSHGLVVKTCEPRTPATRIRTWRSCIKGCLIRLVNDIEIRTAADFDDAVLKAKNNGEEEIKVELAKDICPRRSIFDTMPQLHFDQLHAIAHHLHAMRTGVDLWEDKSELPEVDCMLIHQAVADGHASLRFTRKRLIDRSDWKDWLHSEWKQLDSYEAHEMFGEPLILGPSDHTVLPFMWTYLFKDGDPEKKKARGTCNGGKRFGRAITLAFTYASCVEQPAARIFYAIAAVKGMIIIGANAGNAFAEAPPPVSPFYMAIDQQYRDWWGKKKR